MKGEKRQGKGGKGKLLLHGINTPVLCACKRTVPPYSPADISSTLRIRTQPLDVVSMDPSARMFRVLLNSEHQRTNSEPYRLQPAALEPAGLVTPSASISSSDTALILRLSEIEIPTSVYS